MSISLKTQIQLRNDLAQTWLSVNPRLAKGEIGIEIDTNKIKIGDGVNLWADLPYFSGEIKVDGKSIVLTDGVLSLNMTGAGVGYTPVSDGQGGITWVKPSETTVEGLSGLISALDTRVKTAETEIDTLQADVQNVKDSLDSKAEASALDNYVLTTTANATYAAKEELKNKADSSTVTALESRVSVIEDDYVKNVTYNSERGIFTFVTSEGTQTYDLAIEKVVTNFVYDSEKTALVLTLADGTTQEVPMSAFLNVYSAAKDATEVQLTIVGDQISAELVNGGVSTAKIADKAITEGKLADEVVVKINKGVAASEAVANKADSSTVAAIETRVGTNEQAIININDSLKDKVDATQVATQISEATINASQISGTVATAEQANKVANTLRVTVDGTTTEYDGSEGKEVVINIASAIEPIATRVTALEKASEENITDVKVNGVSLEKSDGSVNITSISTDMLVQGQQVLILDGGNAE